MTCRPYVADDLGDVTSRQNVALTSWQHLEMCAQERRRWRNVSKCKCSVYIAQYPVHWTDQSAVALLGRPVHSDTNSVSPGNMVFASGGATGLKEAGSSMGLWLGLVKVDLCQC